MMDWAARAALWSCRESEIEKGSASAYKSNLPNATCILMPGPMAEADAQSCLRATA
ncbi:protein of unknown function [Pararobbsia alpina]